MTHNAMLIDGESRQCSDGRTFESINPVTGLAWATCPGKTAWITTGGMVKDPFNPRA